MYCTPIDVCISCTLVGVISQLMFAPCSLAPWVSCQDFFVQSDEETDCNSGWGSERRVGVAVDVSEWNDLFNTSKLQHFGSSKLFFWVKLSAQKHTSFDKVFLLQEVFWVTHTHTKSRFTKIWLQHLDRWEAYVGINAFLKFKCKKCHFRNHFQWYLFRSSIPGIFHLRKWHSRPHAICCLKGSPILLFLQRLNKSNFLNIWNFMARNPQNLPIFPIGTFPISNTVESRSFWFWFCFSHRQV